MLWQIVAEDGGEPVRNGEDGVDGFTGQAVLASGFAGVRIDVKARELAGGDGVGWREAASSSTRMAFSRSGDGKRADGVSH